MKDQIALRRSFFRKEHILLAALLLMKERFALSCSHFWAKEQIALSRSFFEQKVECPALQRNAVLYTRSVLRRHTLTCLH